MKSLEIIKKTKDYLVVNKPSGLLIHAASNASGENLANLLLKDYPELKEVGDDSSRPGIVHRLDKNVSGVLVLARTQSMFNYLKKQFKSRQVKKTYQALVYGKLSKDYDTINFPIMRSTKGYKMAAKPRGTEITENIREAETNFQILKKFINYTLLNVKIKTGRTHQIRCHLAAYGHPIVGDDIYSTAKTRIKNKKLNLGRIFLCSTKLGFKDFKGEWQEFSIDLSSDLKNFLKKVK